MSRLHTMRHAGFGLIELMISMVLGLLVLGAAIAVFQSNQRTYSANEGQNRIQEGARAAYEMMSRDIRAAGGTACSKLARPNVEHVYTADETTLTTAPISGGANEFTVVSGDDASYQITAATTTSVTVAAPSPLPPGWKLSDGFKAADKLILCNTDQFYVVTISGGGVNDGARTLTFSPATKEPIYDPGVAPAASVFAARFRTARWFLNGGSLSVQRNGVTEAVVPGVTAMNVTYRQTNGAYTTTPSWTDGAAVRVNLTLRGQQTTGGDVQVDGSNFITRSTSNITAVRTRAP